VGRVGSNLLLLLVASVLGVVPALAQTAEDELGSWFMYFGQNRLYGAYGNRITPRSRFEVGFLWNSFTGEDLGRLQFANFFNPHLHGCQVRS
jgi:hypothetical protein